MPFRPVPAGAPQEVSIGINSFKEGVITLVDESSLPLEAATEARNLIQVQDGRWQTRPGSATYGATLGAAIDGCFEYRKSDGTTELVAVASGLAKKSTDGGAWSTITGGTFTSGYRVRGNQINNRLYMVNGQDNLTFYDGTDMNPYTIITAPVASGGARGSGLATGSYKAVYKIVAINDVGFTTPSSAISVSINTQRDSWSGTASYIDVAWTPPTAGSANVLRYEVYYADQEGYEKYLDSVEKSVTTYRDTAAAQRNPYVEVPDDNTTVGPKMGQIALSGNRIWGTGDTENPYRVYGSGTGPEIGYFSSYYGGFYVDLEKGGREYPSAVVHYRTGRGDGSATVLTSNPEGTGSIWQIELVTATVGDVSFVIPSAVKIVGSVGTTSADSVVNVRDSIQFGNKRGWYALGSKPSLLNVLSSDELSVNIRPFWRTLTGSAIEDMAAYFRDGKVYISYPYGTSVNNRIGVFDLEQRNWNPEAFTFGVKQFLEYTDTSGITHFLAVPITGTQLIEISENTLGDSGSEFSTSYRSGLYPVAKDRTKFAKVRRVYFDVGNLQGSVNLEVLGTEKKRGFRSLGAVTVSDSVSNSGMGTELFGATLFGVSTEAPESFSSSTRRIYVKVNKLLNNWQIKVSSDDLNTKYTLQRAQMKGYIVPTREPSSWAAD